MEILQKSIKDIIPYDKNPRKNDNAVDNVAASIKEFGFKIPIIIDKNNVIVCGHTRFKAAKRLRMKEVPCIVADDLSDEQIRAFRIADNKVSEAAEWDMGLLASELGTLTSFDMEQFGVFDLTCAPNENVEKKLEDVKEDNFEEEAKATTKTKLGDMFKLGDHLLLCGDSTRYEDVQKVMENGKADLVLTDPPYNVNYEDKVNMIELTIHTRNKERKASNIENDNMSDAGFHDFLFKSFSNIKGALKDGGAFYIQYASAKTSNFYNALNEAGLPFKQNIIWNKSHFSIGRSDYQQKHEPCIYGFTTGAPHYFSDSRAETTVIEDEKKKPLNRLSKDELIQIINEMQLDKIQTDIIDCQIQNNDLHPTMKPVRLFAQLINNSTKQGEVVLDLFGGSGTTMVACEQLGRKCRMIEYDPHYVDVIISRWEQLTGEKAVKINS